MVVYNIHPRCRLCTVPCVHLQYMYIQTFRIVSLAYSPSFSFPRIKTGWSTVAARKRSPQQSQMKLPPQEVKRIAEVVAQAEALQMAEELRIG